MSCDVCKRDRATFVHALTTGPMSIASCSECLSRTAEPEFAFEYLYDFVSNDGADLADWVNALSTFKDEKYLTWAEWKAWRQDPVRKEELDKLRDKQMDEYNAEVGKQGEEPVPDEDTGDDEESRPYTQPREVREEDLPE